MPAATVVHHEAGSTSQIAEAMFVELYRSKVIFCRKHYGESAAQLFKIGLWLLYLPRFLLAAAASAVRLRLGLRAGKYLRLIREIKAM